MNILKHFFIPTLLLISINTNADPLTDQTVGRIVEDAKAAANEVLGNAENRGNALIINGADKVNMASENIIRVFGAKLDKQFESLNESERKMLVALDKTTRELKNITNEAKNLKDTAALDVRSILGDIPFVKEKLIMQRIDGLTYIQSNDVKNKVTLIGSYLGLNGKDHRTDVALEINNTVVPTQSDTNELHIRTLTLDKNTLQSLYREKEVNVVSATIKVDQHFKKCAIFGAFCKWKSSKYNVPIHFTLYPAYAGTLTYETNNESFGWIDAGTITSTRTGGNNHCDRRCGGHRGAGYSASVSVSGGDKNDAASQNIGDQRITSITQCFCESGQCGYDVKDGIDLSARKDTAVCNFHGRSYPSTWRITATIEKWGKTSSNVNTGSVDLYYGQMAYFDVPDNSTSIRLFGNLSFGDRIDDMVDQNTSNEFYEIVQIEKFTSGKRIHLKAKKPTN